MKVIFLLVIFLFCGIVALSNEIEKAGDEEVSTFQSAEDLKSHVKKLNEEEKQSSEKWTSLPSESELLELKKKEWKVRLDMEEVVKNYGKISTQYAEKLHALGRSLHKQHRFDEAFTVSKEIVQIHEKLDGHEHENTARALGNLGSVAFRLKNSKECDIAMNRALYIWIQIYGSESKEVRKGNFHSIF
jgi:predicted DNA-binding WGR domain protein